MIAESCELFAALIATVAMIAAISCEAALVAATVLINFFTFY